MRKTANQQVTAADDAWLLSKTKVFLHAAKFFYVAQLTFSTFFPNKKRGCKFNPERPAVYPIWTDTFIRNHGKLLMRSDRLSYVSNSW